MRASTDEVEVPQPLRPVMKAKPCRLPKQGRNRKSSPILAEIISFEIFRRHEKLLGDCCFQARQDGPTERSDDPVAQGWTAFRPILFPEQIGHGTQNIETVATGRRETGVGRRGAVQIE